MKQKKKKCYVLMISRHFMKGHRLEGDRTYFEETIPSGVKIHTLRGSCEKWEQKIKEVNEGKAYLSIRYWADKPYRSKQVEVVQFHGMQVGTQRVQFFNDGSRIPSGWYLKNKFMNLNWVTIAKNDGLNPASFLSWFSKVKNHDEYVIIHFTDFRY